MNRSKWLSTITKLKRQFPTHIPVVVRSRRLSGDLDGTFARKDDEYVVVIDSRLTEKRRYEVLAHEWGHVLEDNERWVDEKFHHCKRFERWEHEVVSFLTNGGE